MNLQKRFLKSYNENVTSCHTYPGTAQLVDGLDNVTAIESAQYFPILGKGIRQTFSNVIPG